MSTSVQKRFFRYKYLLRKFIYKNLYFEIVMFHLENVVYKQAVFI